MPLAIITPTKWRWPLLLEQASALAPQLVDGDLWIIGCDSCDMPAWVVNAIVRLIPPERLADLRFSYSDQGRAVDRLARSLAAFAPPTHDICEVDDHDPLSVDALSEIRHAFDAGYDYIMGWHHQRVQLEPGGPWEQWPTVEREYTPGAFARHEFDAIGLRAVRRSLWDKLGGRDSSKFPVGHYDMAVRAEAAGAKIVCLQKPLCTVTIAPEASICGLFHQLQAAGGESSSESSLSAGG